MRRPLARIAATLGAVAVVAATAIGTTSAAYTDVAAARTEPVAASVPAAAKAIRQANSLDTHAALVEGRLYLWGFLGTGANPGGGTLGAGTGTNQPPRLFAPLEDIVDVSANAYGYKALDADGRLWTWGTNGYYENGGKPGQVVAGWTPLDTDVVATAGSEYANAYLKSDGTVWTTGTAIYGQRGTGNTNTTQQQTPTQVSFPAGAGTITTIGGAYEGFYAVDEAGHAYFWGRDYRGGAGNGNNGDNYVTRPVEVPAITALIQAEGHGYLGGGYAWGGLLTSAGNVYTWGSAENNSHGNAPGNWTAAQGRDAYSPRLLTSDVRDVAISFQSGKAIMSDGTVWAWGENLWGGAFRLPDGSINNDNVLALVYDGSRGPATAVGGTKDTSSLSLIDGTIWTWGENGAGAACGGRTYGTCPQSVTATGTPNGLYVWPPIQQEVP